MIGRQLTSIVHSCRYNGRFGLRCARSCVRYRGCKIHQKRYFLQLWRRFWSLREYLALRSCSWRARVRNSADATQRELCGQIPSPSPSFVLPLMATILIVARLSNFPALAVGLMTNCCGDRQTAPAPSPGTDRCVFHGLWTPHNFDSLIVRMAA
jgi:hypothetical protein